MKKLTAWILILVLMATFCACDSKDKIPPLVFHYPWANLEEAMRQDPTCTAIGSEERDISGTRDSLRYVLTLYFRGPLDPNLVSPFPMGTTVVATQKEEGRIIVTLSNAFSHLKDMDQTLACICLAKTCFGLSDAKTVNIQTDDPNNNISITITRDNYLLEDSGTEATSGE